MDMENPKQLTPEEIAKMEKSRATSDVKLSEAGIEEAKNYVNLKETQLKDETESAMKADEILKKINNDDEMEEKAKGMLTFSKETMSNKREAIINELRGFTDKDPIEFAKSVESVWENNNSSFYFTKKEYVNSKYEKVLINNVGDVKDAEIYNIKMKGDNDLITVGSADIRLYKGLLSRLSGSWIHCGFLDFRGGDITSSPHANDSDKEVVNNWFMKAKKLKELFDNERK